MKKTLLYVLAYLFSVSAVNAQDDTVAIAKPVNDSLVAYIEPVEAIDSSLHIAVFTPLFLDSAYEAGFEYRYGTELPRYFNAGLEFYEGILYAIDSLQKQGIALDVHIFDTRSANAGVQNVINHSDFEKMDMIIGHVNANEARLLANVALNKEIPFINVNFPNDAGVRNNPYYVILNSTIKTQIAGLYKYLQKYHSLSPITVFRKKGAQEDALENMLKELSATTRSVPLQLNFVTLSNNAELKEILPHIKKDADENICIAGSLDINFAKKLAAGLALANQEVPVKVFGMPTWEVIDFSGPEYKNLETYYGTPFPNNEGDSIVNKYNELFKAEFYAKTPGMVYLGIEAFYHFAGLLADAGENISSSIGEGKNYLFSDFDIQPVLNPQTLQIDYYENKKIYFIQRIDGKLTGVFY